MSRQYSSTQSGGGFSQAWIDAVWNKGVAVVGYDANDYRKDACGAWIRKSSYGTLGDYGWEIDHILPVTLGGADAITNLQPLHWKNNRQKSDSFPEWACAIGAS